MTQQQQEKILAAQQAVFQADASYKNALTVAAASEAALHNKWIDSMVGLPKRIEALRNEDNALLKSLQQQSDVDSKTARDRYSDLSDAQNILAKVQADAMQTGATERI